MKPLTLKERIKSLKVQVLTVYFAARDPRMPLLVRMLAFSVAAYALSPIDLIPDFIPVIGFLDDLIIVPLGLALVIRFTPDDVMATAKQTAAQVSERPVSYGAAIVIVGIWIIVTMSIVAWFFRA